MSRSASLGTGSGPTLAQLLHDSPPFSQQQQASAFAHDSDPRSPLSASDSPSTSLHPSASSDAMDTDFGQLLTLRSPVMVNDHPGYGTLHRLSDQRDRASMGSEGSLAQPTAAAAIHGAHIVRPTSAPMDADDGLYLAGLPAQYSDSSSSRPGTSGGSPATPTARQLTA